MTTLTTVTTFLGASARHISGVHVADAVGAATREAAAGHLTTLGYWPHPDETTNSIATNYRQAIDAVADAHLDSSVSIKADRLDYRWDVLLPVLQRSLERNVRVHFDAQGEVDPTLHLVERARSLGADVSATLQSRLLRSLTDAERLIPLQIPIRIVKGQDADPVKPALDRRRSYLALIERLAGRAVHIGVATHHRTTAQPALDMLQRTNTSCSLEQLRSLPRLDFLARSRGIPVRAYIAYGRFGLPYSINEVLRRPAIVWWMLRDAVARLG